MARRRDRPTDGGLEGERARACVTEGRAWGDQPIRAAAVAAHRTFDRNHRGRPVLAQHRHAGVAEHRPALHTDFETVALLLSLYLICGGVAQPAIGALSDRFGRRPVLIVGFTVTALTSFAAMFATSVWALIAARTIQAFGASTGIVISRAIIRDLYQREQAASMIG